MTHFTRTSWEDHEIDAIIADPTKDDVILGERLAQYLGVTTDWLKGMNKNGSNPFLKPYPVFTFHVYRLSDVRKLLQWRQMVWNAFEEERMHTPFYDST